MRLPPEPVLLAAKRWLELLPSSGGLARAQALLTSHPAYDDLTPTQYATALAWMREVGLVNSLESDTPAALRILGALFEHGKLPWVRDADQLVSEPGELPTDVLGVAAALGLDGDAVYAQLVSSWGKVDTTARERVGAAGEAALVELLKSRTTGRVEQVSAWSDGYGYDIEVVRGGNADHLEVKSTTRQGRIAVYLSRHEFDVMRRDESWSLVLVRLNPELVVVGIGVVPNQWIIEHAPRDVDASASWATCKLEIPPEVVEDGIPRMREALTDPLPSWQQTPDPDSRIEDVERSIPEEPD
ncbi:protein NO VEIN domain-containing protein [Agromyces larvae]|uniref:DUF3883 domain-containing protein n=1 Tax=Agromyces larvae TaxID=2929802 RepID=A0ABY4C0D9_9MICO|nr:DUF3883 domain-containing protein [Agromyces larvae]UOE44960.1 DUF3883 domain-containing protein [Agromyces larvae]